MANDRLIPCISPVVATAAGEELLTEAPLLVYYGAGSRLGRILRGVIGARLPRLLASPTLTADLAGSLRALCLDGRGIAWLPETLVAEDLSSGRLAACGGTEWEVPVAVRLFRPNERLMPKAEELWRLVQQG